MGVCTCLYTPQCLAALLTKTIDTGTKLSSFLLLSSAHWGDFEPVSSMAPIYSPLFHEEGFSVTTVIQGFSTWTLLTFQAG